MNFETACEKIKLIKTKPDEYNLTRLYGLYKQALVGDCNTSQPWAVQVVDRAKWDGWDRERGKSKDKAKQQYVALVERLLKADK
jgi:diazepam-binding inhibitor (GABA receptor modulating acyl-CoA-binding protein)